MNSPKLSPVLLCVQLIKRRALHVSAVQLKKQYNYDLDSLVEWKRETKMLLGPQRIPTKTGKLRKKKKDVKNKYHDHCESLSLYSNDLDLSPVSSSFTQPSIKDFPKISDEIFSKITPVDAVPFHKFGGYDSSFDSYGQSSNERKDSFHIDDNATQSKTYNHEMNNNKEFKDCISDHRLVGFHESHANMTVSGQPKQFKRQGSYPRKDSHLDVYIPKLEPIPVKNSPTATKKKMLIPSISSPPVQAPPSYDVISKYPLLPLESLWLENEGEEQLQTFKTDVDQLALKYLPSVKTILNRTMSDLSRFFLHRWREGLINELGEEGFKKYKHDQMRQGTNLHANIMEYLSGKALSDIQIMPENEGHWSSLQQALGAVSDIKALELDVLHPHLLYRGVFDCVAQYKDLLCVIDWKVSKKPRPLLKNTYDDPLQVAAYIGALNADYQYVKKYGEINNGLIVVIYPDGSPAHVHMLTKQLVEHYWSEWLSRLYNYFMLTYTDKFGDKQIKEQGRTNL